MLEKGFSHLLENPYVGKARPDVKEGYRALQIENTSFFTALGRNSSTLLEFLISVWMSKIIFRTVQVSGSAGVKALFARALIVV